MKKKNTFEFKNKNNFGFYLLQFWFNNRRAKGKRDVKKRAAAPINTVAEGPNQMIPEMPMILQMPTPPNGVAPTDEQYPQYPYYYSPYLIPQRYPVNIHTHGHPAQLTGPLSMPFFGLAGLYPGFLALPGALSPLSSASPSPTVSEPDHCVPNGNHNIDPENK